ncbi:MAG: winged helix DNA-binding protein [Halobacteriaceae archaeon]
MSKDIFEVLFRKKPCMMLVELVQSDEELYASALAKKVDCTYSHVVKVLQQMRDADLLEFDKRGRLKIINLTEKGEEIAENIANVRRLTD